MSIFPNNSKRMMEQWIQRMKEGLRDMYYIWSKEMKQTVLDEGVLIFFILVPLFYPLLYSWIYSDQVVREVPVAVVDMSHSNTSREIIRMYDATPDAKVLCHAASMTEAKQLMEDQFVQGILYFPADFESRIVRGDQATLGVYADMSIMLYYKAVYMPATSVVGEYNSRLQRASSGSMTARDEEISVRPLDFDEVPIFNTTGGYGDFIIPAILLLILHQTLLLGIGLSAGTARENNRYRDLVPVSRHYNGMFRIVLGKALCYLMIYAVMGAYVTLAVPKLFGYVQLVAWRPLLALMLPFLLATIFFGMMVSCVVRYRENVLLLVVFISVPLLFLSGVSWPLSNMPGAWQGVADLFPSTFGIRGFVRLNTMGATLADIRPEYRALWIQTVLYFFGTCAVYRYQIIQARRHAVERMEVIRQKAIEAKNRKKD